MIRFNIVGVIAGYNIKFLMNKEAIYLCIYQKRLHHFHQSQVFGIALAADLYEIKIREMNGMTLKNSKNSSHKSLFLVYLKYESVISL
jgi:hypothetical protein